MKYGIGLILAGTLAALSFGAHAAPPPLAESFCAEMALGPDGKTRIAMDPALHVLNGPDKLTPKPPATGTLSAIMCIRNSLALDARDDRIITDLGVPFYLSKPGTGATMVLEMSGGEYRIHFVQGAMTPDEATINRQRLNQFQKRAGAAPDKAGPKS